METGELGRLNYTLFKECWTINETDTLYFGLFERNKSLYFDNLTFVRERKRLERWIKFFLVAVIETAKVGTIKFQKILSLKSKLENNRLLSLKRRLTKGQQLLNYLFIQPIVSTEQIEKN